MREIEPSRVSRSLTHLQAPRALEVAVAVSGGALFGVVAGVAPMIALICLVAGVLAPLLFPSLLVGVYIFAVASFFEIAPLPQSPFSLGTFAGLFLVASWARDTVMHGRAGPDEADLPSQQPLLVVTLIVFLAWTAFSAIWAQHAGAAITTFVRYGLHLSLFPIVFGAIRSARHVSWLFAALIAGGLLSLAYGLRFPADLDAALEGRIGGAGLGPNELGSMLVAGSILAAALATNHEWTPAGRAVALIGSCLCVVGLFLTASRGGLVGFLVALAILPLMGGHRQRKRAIATGLVAGSAAIIWFGAFAPTAVTERIARLDLTGSGRSDIWRNGWNMVEDRPIRGVGAGNFQTSAIRYYMADPMGIERDDYIVDSPKVAHNIYLQVLAELGLVGLGLFCTILVCSMRCCVHAARTFASRNAAGMEALSRGLFIALVGVLTAGFFSSDLFSKQLWLLLAVPPALLSVARHRPERASDAIRSSPQPDR